MSTSTTGQQDNFIHKHPLFSFFLLTLAISWIFLSIEVLAFWGYLPNPPGFIIVINVVFTFGPTIATIITLYILEGKTGLLQLWTRMRICRVGWLWYLFIFVGLPALLLLGLIIQPGALASFKGVTPVIIIQYLVNFIIIWLGGGPLGEEIGWRGFALPRMQPQYGPLRGTLLLSIVWCLWHLPQFLTPIEGGGPGTSLMNFLTNFSRFFVFIVALAIIMTWLFNHTKGSIFIAITAHACIDTPVTVIFPLFVVADFGSQTLAGATGLGVVALLLIIFTRGRLGYQPNQQQT